MRFLKNILPHLNIIMVVVLIVLLIVDICNPFMEFINNNITKGFIWTMCALAIANAVVMLYELRKSTSQPQEKGSNSKFKSK